MMKIELMLPEKLPIYHENWNFEQFLRAKAATVFNSVCLSVTRVDQSKTVQARITKSSPLAAWKTLVLGIVKLFHKFEGGHPERGC